ncbi:MAG: cystathionine beta-lyase [Rhodospirillaceae bacterium]|nr:cystathionine beta-lyase [Rhodospirillaceae bacterium]
MTKKIQKQFATRAVHAGQEPDPSTGAITTPIYATSTYVQESPGAHKGYAYSRSKNPTRSAYETAVADLESGQTGLAFASGMAATSTILELLDQGDHVLSLIDLYGGTVRLFEQVRRRSAGLDFSYKDLSSEENLVQAVRPNTRMIWIESPTNPMLNLVDFHLVADFARSRNILTVVDNTFASPWLQRPLEFGIDIVMHSATKYLNGHSDVIGGVAVVGDDDDLADRLTFLQNAVGGVAAPFDSYLTARGLKTLAIRMERHCQNAMEIAQWLDNHPAVRTVHYPALESHPQFALCTSQMNGWGGGIVTMELDTDLAGARRFLETCRLFSLAESLGGVESLIEHPAIMTHASLNEEQRMKAGISDGLIRLSVGVEDPGDLIADLATALSN